MMYNNYITNFQFLLLNAKGGCVTTLASLLTDLKELRS